MTAISDSPLWLISNTHKMLIKSCLIHSDSMSAIPAVYSNTIESKIVLDCVNVLKRANESFQVGIE